MTGERQRISHKIVQSRVPDQHQNFWQLTCIQSAAQSIPSMLLGGVLAKQYNPTIAITSICIGNLIPWLIGLGVVSMAASERRNTVENVKWHLVKNRAKLMAQIVQRDPSADLTLLKISCSF